MAAPADVAAIAPQLPLDKTRVLQEGVSASEGAQKITSKEGQRLNDRPAALIAEDIYKSFGTLEVLKGVSVTAHEGDVISIIGSSTRWMIFEMP